MTGSLAAAAFGLPEPGDADRALWALHLRNGETLVWAGRPPQGAILSSGTEWCVVPVAAIGLIGGIALSAGMATGTVMPGTESGLTGAMLLIVVGSWGSWGDVWHDRARRRRRRDAITSARALVLAGRRLTSVRRALGTEIEAPMASDPGNLRIGPASWHTAKNALPPMARSVGALHGNGTSGPASGAAVFGLAKPQALRDRARGIRDRQA